MSFLVVFLRENVFELLGEFTWESIVRWRECPLAPFLWLHGRSKIDRMHEWFLKFKFSFPWSCRTGNLTGTRNGLKWNLKFAEYQPRVAVYASRVAEQDYREREPRDRRNKMLVMIFHKLVKQKTYVLNVAIIITTVAQKVFLKFYVLHYTSHEISAVL